MHTSMRRIPLDCYARPGVKIFFCNKLFFNVFANVFYKLFLALLQFFFFCFYKLVGSELPSGREVASGRQLPSGREVAYAELKTFISSSPPTHKTNTPGDPAQFKPPPTNKTSTPDDPAHFKLLTHVENEHPSFIRP